MEITLLSADVPLSKKFTEIAPGQYKEESYPHVVRFTSVDRSVLGLREFHDTLVAAGSGGFCLLKGQAQRSLRNESRAGNTDATAATKWICLDVDFPVTDRTPAEFLDSLGGCFAGTSFVFQYSNGHLIKYHEGWRGHFFLLLGAPSPPPALKAWLLHLNLNTAYLAQYIGLSASGGALTYPLDVTTCQNDKLIYIAPPVCTNFEDPVKERFVLHERSRPFLELNLNGIRPAATEVAKKKHLEELRLKQGLPKKNIKTTVYQGLEVLTNPDPVTVTGKKEERGFVYLNLNGGDSWAYYFPKDKPDILYNFKGEPALKMWDVDKDLFNEYKQTASTGREATGARPFGFLWPDDDQYYRGFAVVETRELLWLKATGSKSKLKDFYIQNGVPLPNGWAVDEWNLCFDPTTEGYADFVKQEVNTYRTTSYMREAVTSTAGIPPIIDRVLSSVCVDPEVKAYFLNWFAHIFQTREKTNTAWIFQGVQGTGKGVLFSHIISPLIGREYCHEMTMDRLDDDFNAYLAENIILFIDEANIGDSKNGERLLNRIKNLITEPEQHIRAMRTNAILRNNYSNVILASNYDEIIPLESTDRRFNVAPRQETPIYLEYEDIIEIGRELPQFANYLHSYKVEHAKVYRVLETDARARLIEVSKTTLDNFFQAIRDGDLSYFTQYLDNSTKSEADGLRYHSYALIVKRWIGTVGNECNVPRSELHTCYQFLQGTNIAATKFNRMCRRFNIHAVPIRVDGQVTRGLQSQLWQLPDDELSAHKEEEGSNVVRLAEKASKPSS